MPVHAPRDADTARAGERGEDVGRARGHCGDTPSALAGRLHEQRHVGDVLAVGLRQRPTLLARAEADAVVGGHDQHRAVVEAGGAEPVEQPPEHPVGVAELQQVPLPVLVDGGLVRVPDLVRGPARRGPHVVALARGEIGPRAVRQHQVEVPEARARLRAQRAEERRVDAAGIVVPACVLKEVAPAVRDRRDAAGEVVRQQLVQVDDARVLGQRGRAVTERALEVRAERGRTEVRLLVGDVELRGTAEEREQVLPVVGVDRELAGLREAAGEDRRDRVRRPFADRGCVLEPGRAACEPSEVREANRVDAAVRVEQRVDRQLVERDQHDGRVGPLACCLRGLRGEREPRDVRIEQEQREEEERRGGEHGQREPGRACAQVELGRAGAERDGDGHEQPAGSARAADRLQHEQRHQAGDEDGVHDPAQAPAEQILQPEQDRRRHEQEHEREHDRVPAGRAAGGEELAVLAEQVEERLRDRERPEHEQVQAGQPPRQGRWPRHVLGPAR